MRKSCAYRKKVRRDLAAVLAACLVFQSGANAAYASFNGNMEIYGNSLEDIIPGIITRDGRCIHHPEHTQECGYKECSHVHTEDCYELTWDCALDDDLASPSDAELSTASPSDATPSDAVLFAATPSNISTFHASPLNASSSDADEEEPDESDEDYEYLGEISLINDVHVCSEEFGCRIVRADLRCQHEHDEECGGADCTFVCESGCVTEEELAGMNQDGFLQPNTETLVSGRIYTLEGLLDLVDVRGISEEEQARAADISLGISRIEMQSGDGSRTVVVWDKMEDFTDELQVIPEDDPEATYTVVYEYSQNKFKKNKFFGISLLSFSDTEEDEAELQAVNFGVRSNDVVITPRLADQTLWKGQSYDLLSGVLVTPTVDENGQSIRVKISEIISNREDYVWDGMTTMLKPEAKDVGYSYSITYSAVNEDGAELAFKTITLPVSDPTSIGGELLKDEAIIKDAVMVVDESTESKEAIRTGTVPWDDDNDKDNYEDYENKIKKAGIDFTDLDNTVRSFDSITYTTCFKTKMQENSSVPNYEKGRLYFEFILPATKEEAVFETESMGWLTTQANGEYEIADIVVDGKDCQVLRGSLMMVPTKENPAAIGGSYREVNIVVRVLAMTNGQSMQPKMTYWLEGNQVNTSYDENHIPQSIVTDSGYECPEHGCQEYQTIMPGEITVTAAPCYNVQIMNGSSSHCQYSGDFDFTSGKGEAPQKYQNSEKNKKLVEGLVKGRVGAYGITLQIAPKNGSTRGLKGAEIPKDKITFDLKLSSSFKKENSKDGIDVTGEYTPLVWSLEGNYDGNQLDGRQLLRTSYAILAAPKNKGTGASSCYNGGVWNYSVDPEDPTTIHVEVSGYEINFDQIPRYNMGDNPKTTYRYYSSTAQNFWEYKTVCFSAGELWIIQPFYNKNAEAADSHVLDKYGSGSFTVGVTDLNFSSTSISGQSANVQTVLSDDSLWQGFDVQPKGSISQVIAYHRYESNAWDDSLTSGCISDGKDWATAGMGCAIYGEISVYTEDETRLVATDQLIKFDDVFFEIENRPGMPQVVYDSGGTVLYGAKPNGMGWDHKNLTPEDDGYDDEMRRTSADGLVFYKSLSDLEADRKVCVAVLIERRGAYATGQQYNHIRVKGHVKNTAYQQGKRYVYMVTENTRAWRISDIAQAAADLYYEGDISKLTIADYTRYAKDHIPSRGTGKQESYNTGYPATTWWINEYKPTNEFENYVKTKYDAEGKAIAGSSGYHFGDSCLVVGFAPKIEKKTAQSQSGGSKVVYDMDIEQRVVDYVLTPTIYRTDGEFVTEEAALKTTVYIEDTLPKGLEYIAGSSSIGGVYSEDPEGKEAGTVIGGDKQIQPTVTKNADGTSTLLWEIENVAIGVENQRNELKPIYFSCKIGTPGEEKTDVKNNQSLNNQVKIWTKGDEAREIAEKHGNLAKYGILIQKSNSISLSKLPDQNAVAAGDPMGFTMNVGNNGNNVIVNAIIAESLPYNGDDSPSSFHGKLIVSDLTVGLSSGTSESGLEELFKFYYTTDKAYQGYISEDLQGEDFTDKSVWKPLQLRKRAGVGQDELPYELIGMPAESDEQAVVIAGIGDIPAQTTLKMKAQLELPDGKPGDYVVNRLSRSDLEGQGRVSIISRMLEGIAWLDADRDGIQDSGEEQMKNVKVMLLKLEDGDMENEENYQPYLINGKPAELVTGQQMDVLTGIPVPYTVVSPLETATGQEKVDPNPNGSYRFYNLPEGIFAVKFMSTETGDEPVDLSEYEPSPVNRGLDDTIDSDGIPSRNTEGDLEYTFIPNIYMPPKEYINERIYHSPYHDSGFCGPKATLRVGKWVDNWTEHEDLAEDEFIIEVTDNNEFETGLVLQHAGDANGDLDETKCSGYIEVVADKEGTHFLVKETALPKEYEYQSLEAQIWKDGTWQTYSDISENSVVVKPGDNILVIVHNKFEHEDYFHDDSSVTNRFAGQSQKPSESSQSQVQPVAILALLPDRKKEETELLECDEK